MDGTVGIPCFPTNPVEVNDDINAKLTVYRTRQLVMKEGCAALV